MGIIMNKAIDAMLPHGRDEIIIAVSFWGMVFAAIALALIRA